VGKRRDLTQVRFFLSGRLGSIPGILNPKPKSLNPEAYTLKPKP